MFNTLTVRKIITYLCLHTLFDNYPTILGVFTHDIYYTKKDLTNLSENEMKNACIILRTCNNEKYKIQNNCRHITSQHSNFYQK